MSDHEFSRRAFVQISAAVGLSACVAKPDPNPATAALAELERRAGGKLGVGFLIPSTGASLSHRGGERFAMASSFKLALAAVILHEADQGHLSLETQLPIGQADMVFNSPIVEENLSKGTMSIYALAKAAQTTSDNAATNVLLRHLGGPSVFTAKLRELGDDTTRLDRNEPAMMKVVPGDTRDTTTPNAMARTIGKILTTDWLTPASNSLLIGWMVETQTGLKRIRAGLPRDWKAGDKTGTGLGEDPNIPDRYNDIAIAWPPAAAAVVITSYYESPVRSANMRDEDQAVLAQVGAIASRWAMSR